MFDDHCHPGDACILNVIDLKTHENIDFDHHINKYTFEVDPFEAIHDEEYYIKNTLKMYKLQKKLHDEYLAQNTN